MSLQPPKATHIGQVWVDPITAEAFYWTGDSGTNDYWSEWAPLPPPPTQAEKLAVDLRVRAEEQQRLRGEALVVVLTVAEIFGRWAGP